ncbi:hypothetical protein LPJ53_003700 [Coemansia erecta]|uniref:GPI inositol-deacylase n=1 Tax=Coemansia erecta TaxID=147472 RepID=A0A9W7Y044_9FUNG|nr:hypothetical protein LPJ53_003700 [Coemansia erecta]
MSGTFSTGRVVRQLRQQTEEALKALGRAVKYGTAPWVFASGASSPSPSPSAGEADAHLLDKRRVNAQIPVKPVYIAPRNPVVLCHGLYGFDVKGPSRVPLLQVHYWRGIREALEGVGARVVVAKVAGTGGVRERAQQLDALLAGRAGGAQVNIVGHSMGGLDARYLITHIRPRSYAVGSLTTVCTPHRGSAFMDWCRDYLSLGYRVDPDQLIRDFATVWRPLHEARAAGAMAAADERLVAERISHVISRVVGGQAADPMDARLRDFAQFLTRVLGEGASRGEGARLWRLTQRSLASGDYLERSRSLLRMVYRRLMGALDTPAYACLTRDYCEGFFNPSTPDAPGVAYFSVGAFMDPLDVSGRANPLKIPNEIIGRAEGANDGFVSLRSAQWGEYLGSVRADHFDFTNRWRVTSLGRDFIGSVAYWSGKWAAWLRRSEGGGQGGQPASAGAGEGPGRMFPGGGGGGGGRFDPVDFYLRMGTVLYQRGF